MEEGEFRTQVEMVEAYKFRIHFDKEVGPDIYMDEPKPLGSGDYPNAGKFLAAAVGNCLCASLAYCVRKRRGEVFAMRAEVLTTLERNERGRFRLTHIIVRIYPEVSEKQKLDQCLDMFEDFCIVTQSVRQGIPVDVQVLPTTRSG